MEEREQWPILLSAVEVAEMLRLSVHNLESMRLSGRGPRYIRLGDPVAARVVYNLRDVLRWLDQFQGS